MAISGRHVRVPLSGAQAHAHRPRHPGRAHASANGRARSGTTCRGIFVLVFAIGSALAGLAGVIGGFVLLTAADAGARRSARSCSSSSWSAGSARSPGRSIASMFIGIVQTFAVAVDYSLLDLLARARTSPSPARRRSYEVCAIKIAQAAPIVPYLLLVLMLIVRPRGLLGTRDDMKPAAASRRPPRRSPALAAGLARRHTASWLAIAAVLLRAAARAGPRQRLRPLAAEPDGHRGGVRALLQPAARADRPAVVRPCRVLRSGRLRGDPPDAGDQPGLPIPDAARAARRRGGGPAVRHAVRLGVRRAAPARSSR